MAKSKLPDLPPPSEDPDSDVIDECRLWIGNIDSRVTEYTLLKLVQKFGPLEKFDFLYHKFGPDKGKPRGYVFVTFKSKEVTDRARKSLHGKFALSKRLVVKNAHLERRDDIVTSRPPVRISGMSAPGIQSTAHSVSAETQIRAIETKLKLMDRGEKSSALNPSQPLASGQSAQQLQPYSTTTHHSAHSKHYNQSKPYGRPTGRS